MQLHENHADGAGAQAKAQDAKAGNQQHRLAVCIGFQVRFVDVIAQNGAHAQQLGAAAAGDGHEDHDEDERDAALAVEVVGHRGRHQAVGHLCGR